MSVARPHTELPKTKNEQRVENSEVLQTQEHSWIQLLWFSLVIRRPEFMVAEIPILLIPMLLLAVPNFWTSALFWEGTLLFFLLFHFGDMVNCLADRELDAIYKTHLSNAVYGLGVSNVTAQIVLTVMACLFLAGHLSWHLQKPGIIVLVAVGLLLGAAYSLEPIRLKGRGLWQVLTLWSIIFVGPMMLMGSLFSTSTPYVVLLVAAAYGVVQEGVVLINTAEDFLEDQASGIRTAAIVLGMRRCVALSAGMIIAGGVVLLGTVLWLHRGMYTPWKWLSLGLFVLCLGWVAGSVVRLWLRLRGRSLEASDAAIKKSARWMPLWITAIAWSFLGVVALWPLV